MKYTSDCEVSKKKKRNSEMALLDFSRVDFFFFFLWNLNLRFI